MGGIAGDIGIRFPVRRSLHLMIPGCRVRIDCSDQYLLNFLFDYFKEFVADPEGPENSPWMVINVHETPEPVKPPVRLEPTAGAGRTTIKYAKADLSDGRVVQRLASRLVFVFGGKINLAAGPCLANTGEVIHFINSRYMERMLCQARLLVHAAGVLLPDGRGLALAGPAGSGKSTLALHLMNLPGTAFVSNDRLMIKKEPAGLSMTGIARHPRVNPGTVLGNPSLKAVMDPDEAARYQDMSSEALWQVENKFEVFIHRSFGPGRFRLDGPLHTLVVLNWRRSPEPVRIEEVSILERPDLLPTFMKQTNLFFHPTEDTCPRIKNDAADYLDLLSDCQVFEITGGIDFPAAARTLPRLFERDDDV